MKLRFLGQTYFTSSDRVETMPSEQKASFRGQSYLPSRPVVVTQSQLGIRKYCGITYG